MKLKKPKCYSFEKIIGGDVIKIPMIDNNFELLIAQTYIDGSTKTIKF